MRVRFGTIALTSRMILGFAVASKASSFTLKTVFSLGFSYSVNPWVNNALSDAHTTA